AIDDGRNGKPGRRFDCTCCRGQRYLYRTTRRDRGAGAAHHRICLIRLLLAQRSQWSIEIIDKFGMISSGWRTIGHSFDSSGLRSTAERKERKCAPIFVSDFEGKEVPWPPYAA